MKINQWTLGLATVGVISLASAVNAEEAKMNALETALSSTTISGYVDTSVAYTLGDQNSTIQSAIPFQSGKSDGFNLNVVKLTTRIGRTRPRRREAIRLRAVHGLVLNERVEVKRDKKIRARTIRGVCAIGEFWKRIALAGEHHLEALLGQQVTNFLREQQRVFLFLFRADDVAGVASAVTGVEADGFDFLAGGNSRR